MSTDINRVIVIGRITKSPELKYTSTGTPVCNISIANNRTWNQGGEKKESVSYFNCIAWNKLGETIIKYCRKGDRIGIEGRLQQRRWEAQDGSDRQAVEVVVENIQFLQHKKQDDAAPMGDPPHIINGGQDVTDSYDDQIPF